MSDYIKREDVLNCFSTAFWSGLAAKIKEIPPADVAPVRHGRWIVGERMPMYDIKGNLSWGNWYTCNQCEFKTYAIEGHITQYRYCPNCGAKMDMEEANE